MLAVAVGIHPHRAASCDAASLSRLRELAKDQTVVAIGEIGVDFSGRSAPRDIQERAFRAQLDLAAELDLPVVVHVRDAGAAARAIVATAPVVHGQVHCYSEGAAEVGEWVRLGFYLSFAGTLTFERSDELRAAVKRVPDDRVLFETDAPYLAPAPHRGVRNEPAFVVVTIAAAARERGADAASLAERSAANARALFGSRIAA
jgi:TatD DNase family protein